MVHFVWTGVLRALLSLEENAGTFPGSGKVTPGWGMCHDDVLVGEVGRPCGHYCGGTAGWCGGNKPLPVCSLLECVLGRGERTLSL